MPTFICVLKRGDLCFLHQNEVKFARQRNKLATNLDLFHMHMHRKPNANTKLDLRSPIVNHNDLTSVKIDIYASYDLLLQSVAHWLEVCRPVHQ